MRLLKEVINKWVLSEGVPLLLNRHTVRSPISYRHSENDYSLMSLDNRPVLALILPRNPRSKDLCTEAFTRFCREQQVTLNIYLSKQGKINTPSIERHLKKGRFVPLNRWECCGICAKRWMGKFSFIAVYRDIELSLLQIMLSSLK